MGVPPSHPFEWEFSLINHPAKGVPPFMETSLFLQDILCPLRLESQFAAMMPKLQAAHPELFSSSARAARAAGTEKVGEGLGGLR